MKDTGLARLERDVFRKFHEDGLFDMYLGALLGVMGAAGWFTDTLESSTLGLLAYAGLIGLIATAFTVARRRVVRPRLGHFKPAPERKRKIRATRLVLLGSVIIGLLLYLAFAEKGAGAGTLVAFMPAIWFANAMLVFGAMAYFLDVPRFYAYGVLFGLPLAVDSALERFTDIAVSPLLLFAFCGVVAFAVGVIKFSRFLREYPVVRDEATIGDV